MKRIIITIVGILLCVGITYGIIRFLEKNKPEAEKKETVEAAPVVEVVTVSLANVPVPITSEGVVATRRETIISAQVPGRITQVNSNFVLGGTFREGDVIAQIDPLNYENARTQAESALADARLALEQEKARGVQAKRDWKKIGGGRTPSGLVLRIPYLESAKARVKAARSALDKAVEDLGRTRIMAPYDCRVREADLSRGSVVMAGARLGLIYDPAQLLVRLPFTLDDYSRLPESPEIALKSTVGGKIHQWQAEVLWDDGAVDRNTLSAYLIVQALPNQEALPRFQLPLPGLFLQAEISGATLEKVAVIPRQSVRGRDQIFVMNAKDELEFRTITIVRSSPEFVYASDGISDGERVLTTRLELPVAGMKLTLADGKDH